MNIKITPKELQKAKRIIKTLLANTPFPDDEWFAISNNWDLNIWTDALTWDVKAALYRVENGKILTNMWHELNVEEALS